jgi:hypothetical protein
LFVTLQFWYLFRFLAVFFFWFFFAAPLHARVLVTAICRVGKHRIHTLVTVLLYASRSRSHFLFSNNNNNCVYVCICVWSVRCFDFSCVPGSGDRTPACFFFWGSYRLEFVDRELSGATTNLLSALWFPALLVRCLSDLCKDARRVFCSEGGSSDLLRLKRGLIP